MALALCRLLVRRAGILSRPLVGLGISRSVFTYWRWAGILSRPLVGLGISRSVADV